MSTKNLWKIRYVAESAHREAGCLYDGQPYVIHLQNVYAVFEEMRHTLTGKFAIPLFEIRAVCFLHDLLEDVPNGIVVIESLGLPENAVQAIQLLTKQKDVPRSNIAATEAYLHGIKSSPIAHVVKLCDRIANVRHSKATKNERMIKMYHREHLQFREMLYDPVLHAFFRELDALLMGNSA